MARQGTVLREVMNEKCPWLEDSVQKGKRVFEFLRYTYQVIGEFGLAVCDTLNGEKFYELPLDAVQWD
jgi:hypothetical protein